MPILKWKWMLLKTFIGMRSLNYLLTLVVLALFVAGCSDDDNEAAAPEPPRPLGEVLTEDEVKIQEYLETHFYNYAEFENPPDGFDFKIRLQSIPEGNTDTVPLARQVQSKTITVTEDSDEGSSEVSHTLYYLQATEPLGQKPTVGDSVFLKYKGTLLEGTEFDRSDSYLWQYGPSTIRGYAAALSEMTTGTNTVIENDGTFTIENVGVGLVIMPSGLAYFNQTRGTIPAYSPLIFTFELGTFIKNTDFDNDGVPSIMEDVNGDGNLNNDNTDEDFRVQGGQRFGIPNHQDSDDDGDGIPTREEVELDDNGNLILPLPDADGDGTPDYLDSDS